MELIIRKATVKDYHSLCPLFDELDACHRLNLPQIFRTPDGPVREFDYYSRVIADQNVGFFVAETSKVLVGFIHAVIKNSAEMPIFVPRCFATVDSIMVSLPFQKRGIGRILMETMQEWALSKGATSTELNVFEFNEAAISFYEGLGYQTLSRKMSLTLSVTL